MLFSDERVQIVFHGSNSDFLGFSVFHMLSSSQESCLIMLSAPSKEPFVHYIFPLFVKFLRDQGLYFFFFLNKVSDWQVFKAFADYFIQIRVRLREGKIFQKSEVYFIGLYLRIIASIGEIVLKCRWGAGCFSI